LDLLSKREEADIQMRHRYADMIDTVIVPTFHGISAFGTRLCFYTCDQATRRITPGKIPRNDDFITDVAPIERWDCDILGEEGEARFRTIVAEVNAMCATLAQYVIIFITALFANNLRQIGFVVSFDPLIVNCTSSKPLFPYPFTWFAHANVRKDVRSD
jgi:hypothetical protein